MSHSGSRLQLQCCGQSVAAGGRDAETEAGRGVDGRSEWLMKTEPEPCWARSVLLCRRLLFASALLLIIFPTVFLKELEERNVPRCLNLRKCTAHLWAYEEIVLIINQNFSVGENRETSSAWIHRDKSFWFKKHIRRMLWLWNDSWRVKWSFSLKKMFYLLTSAPKQTCCLKNLLSVVVVYSKLTSCVVILEMFSNWSCDI